jgi:phosphoribosylaminoimidazole-succinocarboxamide synthase
VTVTDDRLARTEALFRDVNERIAESAESFDADHADFVCECGHQACTERVSATLDEYERVRADGRRFLLRPGHENERIERVVERRPRFAVVEKFHTRMVAIVQKLDPRMQPT